nr:isocitrate lyase/phosphoenolpyruvate mutase family protein [Bradyrhizobium sp. CCBAU 11445]
MLLAQVCLNDELSFLIEPNDGLSATIAQRSGFKGLWASALSIASSLGYRDANEASWSQLVQSVDASRTGCKVDVQCVPIGTTRSDGPQFRSSWSGTAMRPCFARVTSAITTKTARRQQPDHVQPQGFVHRDLQIIHCKHLLGSRRSVAVFA